MCKIASHVLVSAPDIMFCLKSIHSRFFFKFKANKSSVHCVVDDIHTRKPVALPLLAASVISSLLMPYPLVLLASKGAQFMEPAR